MKRDDYLADKDVTGFVQWAGHLVRGECGLEHSYTRKRDRREFEFATLFEAFKKYDWPNSITGPSFDDTIEVFENYRQRFQNIGIITTVASQREFLAIAQEIVSWGGINLPALNDKWGQMDPKDLQALIAEIEGKLDPISADTVNLRGFKYMRSGFSKIYAALIPGFPIYDSRVACALACLVRLYSQHRELPSVPPLLDLGIPLGRVDEGDRCEEPALQYSAKYARSNLQFAWLMQGLVADPGDFENVPEYQRVDALQSALFMLGYARLQDDAVVKTR